MFLVSATTLSLVVQWMFSQDPVIEIAKKHAVSCPIVSSNVGEVTEIKVSRATYVQTAINHNGVITPAYNIYTILVKGKGFENVTRVRVSNLEEGRIESNNYNLSCI